MSISRRQFLVLGAATTAAVATSAWTWGESARPGSAASWCEGPPLPWPTQEVYSTVWNDQIVVAGGLRSEGDNNQITTVSETAIFDPASGAWTDGPELPAPRHHILLGAVEDTVYGFGGFVGGFEYRSDVFAFDGEQWARIGQMPTPLGETVALSVDERIHLVTGSLHGETEADRGETGTHLVYDPQAKVWEEARPAPTARSSATGAVIDGHLYVAGGRVTSDGVTNLGALERYDPKADTWTELRPLPQPSGGLAGAAVDGTLYCFGGEYFSSGGGVYEHTWAYEPAADEWQEGPPMRTPRHGLAGLALDGRVFAIGGNTAAGVGDATSTVVETLDPTDAKDGS